MANVNIEIDVDGAKKVAGALRRGLEDGLEDAGSELLEKGIEEAEDQFTGGRMVWNEEVKNSFEKDVFRFNRTDFWKGKIVNPVKHADVVDRGLAPAGEIEGANPSVQDLMPWVVSNLSPADYGGGDGDPDLSDFDGGDGPSGAQVVNGITSEDRTVSWMDREELGLEDARFDSKKVRVGSLGDGTNVVWKSHTDLKRYPTEPESSQGVVRNEIVWSEAQEVADFDIGPKSRSETVETTQGPWEGTLQEYVPGDQLPNTINAHGDDPFYDEDSQDRQDWIRENRDWAAKVNAIDYIVGNSDRHSNNVRTNERGKPRAIDNGGNRFKEGLDGENLAFIYDLMNYDNSRNPEELYEQNQRMLDRTEEVLDELLQDEDYRNSVISKAKEVHGEGSREHERAVNVLGDIIDEGHVLYKGNTDEYLYKRQLQQARNLHTKSAGYKVDPEDKTGFTYTQILSEDDNDDSAPTLDEIDDELDSMFGEFQEDE